MFQASEVGKRRSKLSVLEAKRGSTFVTPQNRRYGFDFEKVGNKYMVILIYREQRMRVTEVDYNRINTDVLLSAIDKEIDNKNI